MRARLALELAREIEALPLDARRNVAAAMESTAAELPGNPYAEVLAVVAKALADRA